MADTTGTSYGYGVLPLAEKADRVKKLQSGLRRMVTDGQPIETVDHAAVLGLMQITADLENAVREIAQQPANYGTSRSH